MGVPGQEVSRALSRLSTDTPNRWVTPGQQGVVLVFDRIVSVLSEHPINEGIFWDSIDQNDRFVAHTDSFNRALRSRDFRRYAAQHNASAVNDNLWNALVRRYPNMSNDHRGTVNVFLRGKVFDSLSMQLAFDIHTMAVAMMRDAYTSLRNLAGDTAELAMWQARIQRMRASGDRNTRDAGQQLMDGLGIASDDDLASTQRMASSISATARLVDEEADDLRGVAPQNLLRTIVGLPGAQQGVINALQASSGSYVVDCIGRAVDRGQSQLSVDNWVRAASGVVAGIAVGVITGGTGTPAAVGLFTGMGASAMMGAPSLIQAIEAVDEARAGEASGTMSEDAIEQARRARTLNATFYVAGILIPNGAGTYVGTLTEGMGSGVATGAGLSVLFEVLGAISGAERNDSGFTQLWDKLNVMSPSMRATYASAFDQVLSDHNIPASARPAILAAFADAHLSSLDKPPTEASQDLSAFCDTLERE